MPPEYHEAHPGAVIYGAMYSLKCISIPNAVHNSGGMCCGSENKFLSHCLRTILAQSAVYSHLSSGHKAKRININAHP
jgi:hypothetical protein